MCREESEMDEEQHEQSKTKHTVQGGGTRCNLEVNTEHQLSIGSIYERPQIYIFPFVSYTKNQLPACCMEGRIVLNKEGYTGENNRSLVVSGCVHQMPLQS